jgi:hypothetical protein
LIAGLSIITLAWGCYSSIAPVPKVELDEPQGTSSSGVLPPDETVDGCAPRTLDKAPGVTGMVPTGKGAGEVYLLSGDRYFTAVLNTVDGGVNQGVPQTWGESGHIKTLWADNPPIDGINVWSEEGITATYQPKEFQAYFVINRAKRWGLTPGGWVVATDGKPNTVADDWIVNGNGPPAIDGVAPWQGPGVTAVYYNPTNTTMYVHSGAKLWVRNVTGNDPATWSWLRYEADAGPEAGTRVTGNLADIPMWQSAPVVGGQRPWEGKGVTAAWYIGPRLFVFNVDKYWIWEGSRWEKSGVVTEWRPPTAGCPQ